MNRALTPSHSLNKRSVFVVGVDDVHPESSSVGWDYGGDLEQGALGLISNFFNRHPQVKITLFVTPSWRSSAVYELNSLKHQIAMLGKSNVQTYIRRLLIRRLKYRSYPIDLERHRNWCRYLEGFVTVGRIGIGVHGLDHFQNHRPFSAEFERLGREEARNRLRQAQGFFARANLTFERGFSPPGWGINEATLQALADEGFQYVAGSADGQTRIAKGAVSVGAGLHNVHLFRPSYVHGELVNVPRNCGIEHNDLRRVRNIVANNGLIGVQCHIENEYSGSLLGNGISPENIANLEELVCFLEREYPDEIWYATFGQVANYFLKANCHQLGMNERVVSRSFS